MSRRPFPVFNRARANPVVSTANRKNSPRQSFWIGEVFILGQADGEELIDSLTVQDSSNEAVFRYYPMTLLG